MLGPFNQSATAGMSPQMIQQLVQAMQAQGGMRSPMSNPAPQFPTNNYTPAMAAMMPALPAAQGPQSTGDALAPYLAMLRQFQRPQQHAPMPGAPSPAATGPAPGYGPGPNATGPNAPVPGAQPGYLAALKQLMPWLFSNPAATGLPGQ